MSEHITTSPVWASGAVELGLLRFQAEGRTRRPNLALVFWATVFKTVPPCNVDVLWPNGWMDQDTTWYGGRPRPRGHCLRWGTSSPRKKEHSGPPLFGPRLLWPNGRPSQQLLSSCFLFILCCTPWAIKRSQLIFVCNFKSKINGFQCSFHCWIFK